ncbi:hypothetical protein [Nostoc sp. TCL26-01]|nr:hypothetical protein [Nostoc sp. TCL26-01]
MDVPPTLLPLCCSVAQRTMLSGGALGAQSIFFEANYSQMCA